MKSSSRTIYAVDLSVESRQPLFENMVPAGFPSPAADYEEDRLDLNRYLVKHPAATFFVRAIGDSMIGAGIHCGDLLVVDRSLEPKDKNVVIAVLDGELTVKRIRIGKRAIALEPENESYSVRQVKEGTDFQVWGVVTCVIHSL
ncbi:MAG: translesion error-prone DNA polymerase V autoproteolytic subunit [Sedimentisphaerales bacterium]|nr:translesion error-prone DNA polymerase V autoproteolytic subunit [Sedimentisphaerales bacterium]